jgi:hypothetical protein
MGKIKSRNLRERSYDCHYHCRAIRNNYRGHQAKSKTVEHSFDDVDNRGWLRTSDILPVRGSASYTNKSDAADTLHFNLPVPDGHAEKDRAILIVVVHFSDSRCVG